MTFEIALLLGLIAIAVVFFCFEWIPADVVALGLLLALMLTGLLPPKKAFAGFGSETVIMILGLLIMTAALLKAGVVDIIGRLILRRVGKEHGATESVYTWRSRGSSATASSQCLRSTTFGLLAWQTVTRNCAPRRLTCGASRIAGRMRWWRGVLLMRSLSFA